MSTLVALRIPDWLLEKIDARGKNRSAVILEILKAELDGSAELLVAKPEPPPKRPPQAAKVPLPIESAKVSARARESACRKCGGVLTNGACWNVQCVLFRQNQGSKNVPT